MKTGIYEIVNVINGKRYLGSSENIEYRWRKHRSKLKSGTHCNTILQNAYNKYGVENFKYNIVLEIEIESLLTKEQWYLDNTRCEYNVCKTVSSVMKNRKHSESSRKKISEKLKGRDLSEETKNKIRLSLLGRKRPDISALQKNRPAPWVSERNRERWKKFRETKLLVSQPG